MQDVREEKVITTKSGLKYADMRIGGGTPVHQGMLVILDYRYFPFSCQTAPKLLLSIAQTECSVWR